MKLHLGCGPNLLAGFLNIDMARPVRVRGRLFMQADILTLRERLPLGCADHILAEMLIEHIPQLLVGEFLWMCRYLCRQDALLELTTPDFAAIASDARGYDPFVFTMAAQQLLNTASVDAPGMPHRSLHCEASLRERLTAEGFVVTEVEHEGYRGWSLRIKARAARSPYQGASWHE